MQSKSTFFHFFQRNEILCVTSPTHIRPPPQHTHNTIILFIILLKGKQKLFHPSPQSCTWPFSLSLSLSLSFSPCAHLHAAPRHITHTFEHTQNPSHTLSLSLFQYTKHTGTHPLLGDLLSLSHLPIYCPLLPSHLFSLSPTLMAFKYFYALQMYRTNLCA